MTHSALPDQPRDVRRAGITLFLFALSIYAATTGGSMATDTMSYEVTKSLVEEGSVAVSYDFHQMEAHRGRDGRYYSPYGIAHAIYGVPFYVAGRLVEGWTGASVGKPEVFRKAGFVLGSAVAAAATVAIAFRFALAVTGHAPAAVGSALALGFATVLWPYAKFGFNAPLATLCLLAGTYWMWAGVREGRPTLEWAGGAGYGAALLVRHELVLAAVPAAVWLVCESRRFDVTKLRLVRFSLPILAALALMLYYNYARFGNPIDTGYLRDQTAVAGSIWIGVPGLLVSPGRSLFLYSPIVLAGVAALIALTSGAAPRIDRSTAWLFAGTTLILLLFYGSLGFWDADRSYGPRYLVPVLPYLCIPLVVWLGRPARDRTRRLVVALAFVSTLVQLPGVLMDFSKAGYTPVVGPRTWEQRRWEWRSSGLVLNTKAAVEALPQNARYLASADEVPAVRGGDGRATDFSAQFAFSLDFWWIYLFYMRVLPAWAALILGAVPCGAAFFFCRRLRHVLDYRAR